MLTPLTADPVDVAGDKQAKLVFRINYQTKARTDDGRRVKLQTNELVSGGIVKASDLTQAVYDELKSGK